MIRRLLPILVVVLGVLGACDGDRSASPPKKEDECRLPSPKAGVDPSLIPESFLPPGDADVTQTEKRRGRLVVVMTVPGTIQSVLDEYRSMVEESDFDLLQEDNEGLERDEVTAVF